VAFFVGNRESCQAYTMTEECFLRCVYLSYQHTEYLLEYEVRAEGAQKGHLVWLRPLTHGFDPESVKENDATLPKWFKDNRRVLFEQILDRVSDKQFCRDCRIGWVDADYIKVDIKAQLAAMDAKEKERTGG
jgi:hypothetical protein